MLKHVVLTSAGVVMAMVVLAAQAGVAGKWIGEEQGRHPVALELIVKGSEVTGTVSVGEDPIKTVTNGKVEGAAVTFTTAGMMNGREIAMTWRGTLKNNELTFVRQLGTGPSMPPLVLRRPPR